MNEKVYCLLFIIVIFVSIGLVGTTGFLLGRGNLIGSSELESANRELTATIEELRTELNYERAITGRIRIEQTEERNLINSALRSCRSAGDSVQGVITKMEILNSLIRQLERRADRNSDISGE